MLRKTARSATRVVVLIAGTHLELAPATPTVTRRFKRVIALLFMTQIVLPFTAPLHMADLCDLLAILVHRSSSTSPESMTTLAMSEATSETAGVSLVAPVTTCGVTSTPVPTLLSTRVSFVVTSALFSAPQVQRSVLRL